MVANDTVVDVDGGTFPPSPAPRSSTASRPRSPCPPEHGQHTEEVLVELGRSWDEIAELKQRGAVL